MLRWIGTLLDRAFAVAGALLFSQLPLFMQQYAHQLYGHVAELQYQVEVMRQAASQSGKSLEQLVHKFLDSRDVDFVKQGEIMQAMVDRYNTLSDAYSSMQSASVLSKPFIFVRYLNWDMVKSTVASFQFGISFTVEGAAYALLGMCLGFLLFWALKKTLIAIYNVLPLPKKRPMVQP